MNDLLVSWYRMWSSIGAKQKGDRLYNQLIACYSQSHRCYHSLQHLYECLQQFNQVIPFLSHPAEVEAALWFHDAIYDPQRHDNEEQSATWAHTALLQAEVEPSAVDRVEHLVLTTKYHAPSLSPDEQFLVDIDLAILGASEARFAEYQGQIRAEYSFVPDALFYPKRRAILCSFLDRPRIYNTSHFYGALEEQARANLCRAVNENAG